MLRCKAHCHTLSRAVQQFIPLSLEVLFKLPWEIDSSTSHRKSDHNPDPKSGPSKYDGASDTHSCTRLPHVVRAHSGHSVSTARLCSVRQINLRNERRVGTQRATCGTLTICSQNMRGGSCFLQAYVRRDGALMCIRFYFLEPKTAPFQDPENGPNFGAAINAHERILF